MPRTVLIECIAAQTKDRVVKLSIKTCPCDEFQIYLLLCTHAMAAIRLGLGWRDMQFPFTWLGIVVSGTSPPMFNKLLFCHQLGEFSGTTYEEKDSIS
ncbi:zinc finger protein [Theobroma cacao]|nr:zinc finger protein [Theobroma cacao]